MVVSQSMRMKILEDKYLNSLKETSIHDSHCLPEKYMKIVGSIFLTPAVFEGVQHAKFEDVFTWIVFPTQSVIAKREYLYFAISEVWDWVEDVQILGAPKDGNEYNLDNIYLLLYYQFDGKRSYSIIMRSQRKNSSAKHIGKVLVESYIPTYKR